MPILTARFTLDVTPSCLVEVADATERPRVGATIGDFTVTVTVIPADHWRRRQKDASAWTTGADQLEVRISRDEPEAVPGMITLADGTQDLTVRGVYLYGKLPEYKAVAQEAANRVLRYFRDQLLTPSVKLFPSWTQALSTPTWFDHSDNELRGGNYVAVLQPTPGADGRMGVRKLGANDIPALELFLQSPIDTPLELTLLSDAQTAWFEGNLRRSVLELAICVEVLVKRKFFAAASPAGAAFDYLEDKAKVSVRVLELLDAVALEAFGQSYKLSMPACYQDVDHLFRCRNKVAHRGELAYRNDAGQTLVVDSAKVESWWQSVANLRTWIRAL